jgi:hypothetical protein
MKNIFKEIYKRLEWIRNLEQDVTTTNDYNFSRIGGFATINVVNTKANL